MATPQQRTRQRRFTQQRRDWAFDQAGGDDLLFYTFLFSQDGPDVGIEGDVEIDEAMIPEGIEGGVVDTSDSPIGADPGMEVGGTTHEPAPAETSSGSSSSSESSGSSGSSYDSGSSSSSSDSGSSSSGGDSGGSSGF